MTWNHKTIIVHFKNGKVLMETTVGGIYLGQGWLEWWDMSSLSIRQVRASAIERFYVRSEP